MHITFYLSFFLPDPKGAGHAKAFQFLSVGPSVGQSVSRSVGLSVCRSVGLSVCRSVGPTLLSCPSVRRSVSRSVGRSVGPSVGRSVGRLLQGFCSIPLNRGLGD